MLRDSVMMHYTATFDAAHFLQGYTGACANIHGHTYRVDVGVRMDEVDSESGMAYDFKYLKEEIDEILEIFDHKFLNDLFPRPTAEILAQTIAARVSMAIDTPRVVVRLWETPECSVEVEWVMNE
jgi:6-pyruvoyltetrahydropterin/6-carboxytetrahydropterin synthase